MTGLQFYVSGPDRVNFWSAVNGEFNDEMEACANVRALPDQSVADFEAICRACFKTSSGIVGPVSDGVSDRLSNAVRLQLSRLSGAPLQSIPAPTRVLYKVWQLDSNLNANAFHAW